LAITAGYGKLKLLGQSRSAVLQIRRCLVRADGHSRALLSIAPCEEQVLSSEEQDHIGGPIDIAKMIVERDLSILASDGIALRADIYRPDDSDAAPLPAIMVLGPYGKGVEYKEGYKLQWDWILKQHPRLLPGSTKSYMTWETIDPELWTSWGYICVRVDSRGTGRSPGRLEIFSPREVKDYAEAIEWAGAQPWCNGKVGLCGISYYAMNQWQVAALQPRHLTAMIPWEGAMDWYRDLHRHGGIMSNAFLESWYDAQVVRNQHGQIVVECRYQNQS